jgi:hypothetical protein
MLLAYRPAPASAVSPTQQSYLGKVTLLAGNTATVNGRFVLPEGTQSVLLTVNSAQAITNVEADLYNADASILWGLLTVGPNISSGHRLIPIVQRTVPILNSVALGLVAGVPDPRVQVNVLASVGNPADVVVNVYAVLLPEAAIVKQDAGDVLNVNVSSTKGGGNPYNASTLPVANYGPGVAPNTLAVYDGSLVAGATLLLLAGTPSQFVELDQLSFFVATATVTRLSLEDTNSVVYAYLRCDVVGHQAHPFLGLRLPVGVGVQLHNLAGANSSGFSGYLLGKQAQTLS